MIEKIRRRVMVWRIEKALGIELFDWQIAKIFDDKPFPDYVQRGRCMGKTTAQILFVLLCPKLKHSPTIVHQYQYGFPPLLRVDEVPCCGALDEWEFTRVAFFFGEDGVVKQRRVAFLYDMRKIAAKLKAAKIKTHHVEYVYRGRTHHL